MKRIVLSNFSSSRSCSLTGPIIQFLLSKSPPIPLSRRQIFTKSQNAVIDYLLPYNRVTDKGKKTSQSVFKISDTTDFFPPSVRRRNMQKWAWNRAKPASRSSIKLDESLRNEGNAQTAYETEEFPIFPRGYTSSFLRNRLDNKRTLALCHV